MAVGLWDDCFTRKAEEYFKHGKSQIAVLKMNGMRRNDAKSGLRGLYQNERIFLHFVSPFLSLFFKKILKLLQCETAYILPGS